MKPKLILILLTIIAFTTTAQNIYFWTDNEGVTHFSDAPNHQAQKHIIPPHTATEPKSNTNNETPDLNPIKTAPSPQQLPPLTVSIFSPIDGETIRSNQGSIRINADLNRTLTPFEGLQLVVDGQPIGAPSTKTVWDLKNVDRGSHHLSIQGVGNGKVIASSSIVTVHLHRASVN